MSMVWTPATVGSVTIKGIVQDDIGRHEAPADAEAWQESWCLAWHDPHRRCGGWHHIGLQRNRGFADVWNWLVVDGRVVGRYDNLRNPLPEEDFPDFTIGGMGIVNHNLRDYGFQAEYDTGAGAELEYAAYTDPFSYDLRADLIDMGTDHYESHGRITGSVEDGRGKRVAIDGFGWSDHSWGVRDWSQSLAHRWLQANFGPTAFISAWQVMTATDRVLAGYIYADGAFHGVQSVQFGAGVHDDGYSPARSDTVFWTDTGQGFHVTSTVGASVPVMHDASFWMTDGLATFEMGGKLGAGFFEVHERNRVPAEAEC